ncbi:MAG: GFA family protein [Methyloceanibacter sp.]
MPDASKYGGGCHCGAVRYEVESDLGMVLSCNCSFCQKRGALWAYVAADDFRLISGEDALTDYQFNRKVIHHLFCRTCGVGSFSKGESEDGSPGYGINVRCLDGVDVAALTLTPFDGKNRR